MEQTIGAEATATRGRRRRCEWKGPGTYPYPYPQPAPASACTCSLGSNSLTTSTSPLLHSRDSATADFLILNTPSPPQDRLPPSPSLLLQSRASLTTRRPGANRRAAASGRKGRDPLGRRPRRQLRLCETRARTFQRAHGSRPAISEAGGHKLFIQYASRPSPGPDDAAAVADVGRDGLAHHQH